MENKKTGMSFYLQYLKDKIEKPLIYGEPGTGKVSTVFEYIENTNLYADEDELRNSASSYSPDQYERVLEYQKYPFCDKLHPNIKIFDKSDNSLIESLEVFCVKADTKDDMKNYIFEKLTNENEYWGKNELLEMIDFCNRNQLDLEKKILMQFKP